MKRVKMVLPFLSIALLIAGSLLCINIRTLRFVQQINAFFYDRGDGDARSSNSFSYQTELPCR